MKILYVTDLHGNTEKYNRLFEIAREKRVDIVINGGDMLPKTHGDLFRQEDFIKDFLNKHFSLFDSNDIHYLCCLGNDDLKIFDKLFEEVCFKHPFVCNLSQRKFDFYDGHEFIGFNLVVDTPFRIKDRCRMDTFDYKFQKQYGEGLLSTPWGFADIDDWPTYAKTIKSLEEELTDLVWPNDISKTIYIMHQPPTKLGLDTCYDGREVGSEAIHNFLKDNQPLISLHGHIHESPDMTDKRCGKIGDTICIQPGQPEEFVYVIIELPSKKVKMFKE